MINSAYSPPHAAPNTNESASAGVAAHSREGGAKRNQLLMNILTRIESRLPGRIRGLSVSIADGAVVLRGQCSTYYTKQVAQHAAMGVLEYQRVVNRIDVRPPK